VCFHTGPAETISRTYDRMMEFIQQKNMEVAGDALESDYINYLSERDPERFSKELLIEKNFIDVNYMVLRGKTDYKAELSTSPVGNMLKLENLCHGISSKVPELEKMLEQYQRDLEQAKEEYEKPFMQEEELKEKTARLNELNVQLDLEKEKVENVELCEKQDNEKAAEPGSYHMDYCSQPLGKEGR